MKVIDDIVMLYISFGLFGYLNVLFFVAMCEDDATPQHTQVLGSCHTSDQGRYKYYCCLIRDNAKQCITACQYHSVLTITITITISITISISLAITKH